MEFNLETYYKLLEWSSSREGILVALIVLYFAWFFIPAVQVSFFDSEGERTDPLTKVIVFLVVFLVLPPLLILGIILNFLGLLSEEEGVEV
tara:strand:+ start:490 stop:762 length:273 start_codon:yes stop_codon:yes gene_type:complete